MKRIIFALLLSFMATTIAFAGDHPQAHFGKYGIEHHSTLGGYQKYVGQTVKYIPESPRPSYDDKARFQSKGGKFYTPYVITRVSGDDKRITFFLKEKGGKATLKLIANNQPEYYSYGNYTYCITEKYSIPILLIDKLEKFVDRQYPDTNSEGNGRFIISKISFRNLNNDTGYPAPCFEVTDTETNKKFYVDASEDARLESLGKVFTNQKVKATYKVVGLTKGYSKLGSAGLTDYFIVQNSLTSQTKEVEEGWAEYDSFKTDLDGNYVATLSKVEKPSNPAVRYGKTSTIKDEGLTMYNYIDSHINIIIYTNSTQFNFVLENVSDNSIKVIWNEAVFVDSDGSTSKIMHIGTKYSQKEGDQPATVIIKGAKITDLACPTKNVRYNDVLENWVMDSMFPSQSDLEVKPIRLMLPIQVKDVINEYVFVFDVKWGYNHPELLTITTK